jgi:hypothetical protein
MTTFDLLHDLERAGCEVVLASDTLKVRGPLTDDLRQAIRQHKPDLVALLREREGIPKVIDNCYCFDCFRELGKHGRHQPHRVVVSHDQPGWWELTCTRCGSKSYMQPERGGGENAVDPN